MSLVTDLPAIFDQFSEARQKGFLTVMDLKERGIPLVGTYCTFMPQEIPMAAGAVVVSLCSTSDETIEEAGNDSNLLIVFYVQIMPDDFVMQLHR
ncbi:hypothetical protein PO407_24955, partial [Escherichia coli]